MKIKFLLVFVLITLNSVHAQFGYGKLEDVQKIKKIPLLVVLEDENDGAKEYNEALQTAFEKNWNFSKEVKVITKQEFKEYNSKAQNGNYAFFKKVIHKGDDGFSQIKLKGLITTHDFTIGIVGNKKPVYSIMYPTGIPNEADFKFMIQQIQYYLQSRVDLKTGKKSKKEMLNELASNAGKIKNKTLLLAKDDLTSKLLNEIDKIYSYKYKITTKEEIDSAILSNDANIAYIKVVPVGQMTGSNGPIKVSKLFHVQYVVDAKDGQVLTYVRPKAFGLGGAVGAAMYNSKKMLTKKDMTKIVKAIVNAK
ncbi:MAG TPA: hypothetical protein ENK46_01430 [Flavobacteriia bacterium]|nr:hypothetical protein [Flavobacteriia bacterium]